MELRHKLFPFELLLNLWYLPPPLLCQPWSETLRNLWSRLCRRSQTWGDRCRQSIQVCCHHRRFQGDCPPLSMSLGRFWYFDHRYQTEKNSSQTDRHILRGKPLLGEMTEPLRNSQLTRFKWQNCLISLTFLGDKKCFLRQWSELKQNIQGAHKIRQYYHLKRVRKLCNSWVCRKENWMADLYFL